MMSPLFEDRAVPDQKKAALSARLFPGNNAVKYYISSSSSKARLDVALLRVDCFDERFELTPRDERVGELFCFLFEPCEELLREELRPLLLFLSIVVLLMMVDESSNLQLTDRTFVPRAIARVSQKSSKGISQARLEVVATQSRG